jgi:hypothetical protein
VASVKSCTTFKPNSNHLLMKGWSLIWAMTANANPLIPMRFIRRFNS